MPQMSTSTVLTHKLEQEPFEVVFEEVEQRIRQQGDLATASAASLLELASKLAEFPLGRFLLQNRGLDGYWTDYVIHKGYGKEPVNELEAFLLYTAPGMRATQERFTIFQREIQKHIRNGAVLASAPCGVMSDLLSLDFASIHTIELTGWDIDPRSLELAEQAALKAGLQDCVSFALKSAWELGENERFDLLTSNGLNIYEPDDAQVVALYRSFFNALKPGGVLVASFLTPPPVPGCHSEWDLSRLDLPDLQLQMTLFHHVIQASFLCYRTREQTESQLRQAGFRGAACHYDSAKIFPTVVAVK